MKINELKTQRPRTELFFPPQPPHANPYSFRRRQQMIWCITQRALGVTRRPGRKIYCLPFLCSSILGPRKINTVDLNGFPCFRNRKPPPTPPPTHPHKSWRPRVNSVSLAWLRFIYHLQWEDLLSRVSEVHGQCHVKGGKWSGAYIATRSVWQFEAGWGGVCVCVCVLGVGVGVSRLNVTAIPE